MMAIDEVVEKSSIEFEESLPLEQFRDFMRYMARNSDIELSWKQNFGERYSGEDSTRLNAGISGNARLRDGEYLNFRADLEVTHSAGSPPLTSEFGVNRFFFEIPRTYRAEGFPEEHRELIERFYDRYQDFLELFDRR